MLEKKREEREKKERKREEKRQRKEDHSGEQSESSMRESEGATSRAATSSSFSFVSELGASSASNATNKESARSLTVRRDSVNSDVPSFTEPSISEEDSSIASESGSVSARKKCPDVNLTMKGWLELKRDKTSPRPGSNKEKLWFVLEGNKLKYYKTAPVSSDPLPLGVIDLAAAKIRKSRTKKKTFSVEIPVTHGNHVTSPHVTVSSDTLQQDPVGVRSISLGCHHLKKKKKPRLNYLLTEKRCPKKEIPTQSGN